MLFVNILEFLNKELGSFFPFFILFIIGLSISWLLLPFAIFGVKSRLNALINQLNYSNRQLSTLRKEIVDTKKDCFECNKNDTKKYYDE